MPERWMRRALALAEQAACLGETPVGAVVVQGDRIIAEAFNRRETDRDPTAHAELLAIRRAAKALGSWRLEDCSLVVTLEPCPMCAGAIQQARLGRLYYGASDPKAGYCGSLALVPEDERLPHQTPVYAGILQEECAQLMRAFFREPGVLCFPTVERQLTAFAEAISGLLGGELLGLYLHGSLAFGDFQPWHSDIDLLAVSRNPLPPERCEAFTRLCMEHSMRPHPIEVSLLCAADLREPVWPLPFQAHYSEGWRERLEKRARDGEPLWQPFIFGDRDLAAHIQMLRHGGSCLYGVPIKKLFPAPPRAAFEDALGYDADDALEQSRSEKLMERVYAVLNLCRRVAWDQQGLLLSKGEGGRWALGQIEGLTPAFTRLIQEALDAHTARRQEVDDAGLVEPKCAEAFVRWRMKSGRAG